MKGLPHRRNPKCIGKTTWGDAESSECALLQAIGSDYSLTQVQLAQITATRHTISTVQECLAPTFKAPREATPSV